MFFNGEAYKKAYPKQETKKPAARAEDENTCDLYDDGDQGESAPIPDEINEPAEEANDGNDADDVSDGPGTGEEADDGRHC